MSGIESPGSGFVGYNAIIGDSSGNPSACIIEYPPFPPWRDVPPAHTYTTGTLTFTPHLSDSDIERIAQRVAELIKPKRRKAVK